MSWSWCGASWETEARPCQRTLSLTLTCGGHGKRYINMLSLGSQQLRWYVRWALHHCRQRHF